MNDILHINDVFFTVQGEGANAGRRALFVRMPFCNLACTWCDTQFDTFKEWKRFDFMNFVAEENTTFAVITGGEPTMHKHTPLVVESLRKKGFDKIAIETNGMFPIPPGIDWVCVSPKKFNKIPYFVCSDANEKANEFKYVVDDLFDFSILERHEDRVGECELWLSPEFTKMEENVKRILHFQRTNPEWRLSLQTHKFIGVP